MRSRKRTSLSKNKSNSTEKNIDFEASSFSSNNVKDQRSHKRRFSFLIWVKNKKAYSCSRGYVIILFLLALLVTTFFGNAIFDITSHKEEQIRQGVFFPLMLHLEQGRNTPIIRHPAKSLDFPILIQNYYNPNGFHSPTLSYKHRKVPEYGGLKDDDSIDYGVGSCRRLRWHRWSFPNCNAFHEMDSSGNVPKFLSNGAYRDVFLYKNNVLDQIQNIIWKQILYADYDFTYDTFEFTRMDAIVSERLTSHPRIVDIYGHCGHSIFSEFMYEEIESLVVPGTGTKEDLDDEIKDLQPQNNLSAKEKLQMALDMAEAIAALHDFPDGRMVHNDIQLGQFLLTKGKFVKLNDFNRAEIMLWDQNRHQYCKYCEGEGSGSYRSPEEYKDKALDEKIDVYSFGNNIYTLLTGLWPYYDDSHVAKKKVKKGIIPFIDPRYEKRSYEEYQLVKIMKECWKCKQEDRPSMDQIMIQLKGALDISNKDKNVDKQT
mmetsp:Transcript_33587/g.38258  ORF Transcript_33587/g.38258 Transcript_33587/m.38258 type:complete len:486 (+) Transcript_33587:68-1525(+)